MVPAAAARAGGGYGEYRSRDGGAAEGVSAGGIPGGGQGWDCKDSAEGRRVDVVEPVTSRWGWSPIAAGGYLGPGMVSAGQRGHGTGGGGMITAKGGPGDGNHCRGGTECWLWA